MPPTSYTASFENILSSIIDPIEIKEWNREGEWTADKEVDVNEDRVNYVTLTDFLYVVQWSYQFISWENVCSKLKQRLEENVSYISEGNFVGHSKVESCFLFTLFSDLVLPPLQLF